MVQLPAEFIEAVVPETVQTEGVRDAKLTVNPEVAVAVRFSGVPTVWPAIGAKEMVWVAWPTPKL